MNDAEDALVDVLPAHHARTVQGVVQQVAYEFPQFAVAAVCLIASLKAHCYDRATRYFSDCSTTWLPSSVRLPDAGAGPSGRPLGAGMQKRSALDAAHELFRIGLRLVRAVFRRIETVAYLKARLKENSFRFITFTKIPK